MQLFIYLMGIVPTITFLIFCLLLMHYPIHQCQLHLVMNLGITLAFIAVLTIILLMVKMLLLITLNQHGSTFTGGGSQSFRELLLTQIMPWVSTIAPNSSRIGIWGHSLGAIFVLDCLKIIHALTIIIYLHHHFYGRMKESSR